MGLIKAGIGALGGTLADQWKEFFYCDSLDANTLVDRGEKRIGSRSSNVKGHDNIISNGSGIAVADGQCMLIVEQGEIVEVSAEPGEYTYDTSTEPSIFAGSLGESIKKTFQTIGRRFTYGGDTGKDQRVYYVNTKEIVGNKFGTPNPISFRVVDANINLDIDVSVRANGVYSYKIVDPLLFYRNVTGNVENTYHREEIDSQLKSEFLHYLAPAFARISTMGVRPNQLVGMNREIAEALQIELTEQWTELRGLEIVSIGLNSVTLPPEDEELIKQAQRAAIMRDPSMAAATLVAAQSDAMKGAATNEGGAITGFMGLGMAQSAGGADAEALFRMGDQKKAEEAAKSAGMTKAEDGSWMCQCGTDNTGKFCKECGEAKPQEEPGWQCSCGEVNQGKFCKECGKKKPPSAPLYRCDNCGYEPDDPENPPKFCPECGDVFDENDQISE
ncbi:MAG: SPFH domain-containing protein [Eubacteriales bacterium]|nr:SPFH domain-containing protein [Eubacteriales bacterium]MDD3610773.1 SPFH domain-containing protein [Eubacteriales bacterium]